MTPRNYFGIYCITCLLKRSILLWADFGSVVVEMGILSVHLLLVLFSVAPLFYAVHLDQCPIDDGCQDGYYCPDGHVCSNTTLCKPTEECDEGM